MITNEKQALTNFWTEWARLGEEIVQYGKDIGFGMCLVEVKFQDSVPAIVILSRQINTIYKTNDEAKMAIAQVLENSESADFDGARTFTIGFNKGRIVRVILDEYGNKVISSK